jgi:hypothetical protein
MSTTITPAAPVKFSFKKGRAERWVRDHSYEWRVFVATVEFGTIYAEEGVHDGEWEATTLEGVAVGFAKMRNDAAKLLYDHSTSPAVVAATQASERKSRSRKATITPAEGAEMAAAAAEANGDAAKPPSKRTRKSRTARAAEVAAADAAARQPDGEAVIVRDAEGLPQITRDAG